MTTFPPLEHPVRFRPALWVSIAAAGVLAWCYFFQRLLPGWEMFTAQPRVLSNLWAGPAFVLLHASPAHLLANAFALIVLGTLALALYPRATVRTLPLAWLSSYAMVWLLGQPGSHHLGFSGVVYGLMALLTTLGMLRRDRPAIAAGLIVWFLFAGAWWAMMPGYPEVSWEGHLGGALGGALGAVFWWRRDPSPFPPVVWDEDTDAIEDLEVKDPSALAFEPAAQVERG